MDHTPVLPPAGPFLRNVHHGQIQHFQQAVIRRKDRFCLGYFPNVKTYFPEKLCWAIPYEGAQAAADSHLAVYRLIADMESHGLRAGYNNGQGSP